MVKTTDFPPELRHFARALDGFGWCNDAGAVFRDFVDYLTCCLLVHGDPKTRDSLMDRYADDYARFKSMYAALLATMDDMLATRTWCDPLGHLYQAISSQGHKSGMGQFFTPEDICDLMTQLTVPADARGLGFNDPAAGSGRTLLSIQVHTPGNTLYAQDLDPVCAKMCALNLALHGARGYVVCGDTLRGSVNFGYRVNPWQHAMGGIPHLLPLLPGEATPLMYPSSTPEPAVEGAPAREPVFIQVGQLELFQAQK